jgi:hypothetical protein
VTISTTAKGQVFKSEGGGFLVLITIMHSSLVTPLRFVNNNVNVTSNGNLFLAFPFSIKLPTERDGQAPLARLTIDNVSGDITRTLRQIATPLIMTVQVCRIDSFDSIEATLPTFKLRNVGWDVGQITGDLTLDDLTLEPFPAHSFTPSEYPGVFKSS